MSTIPAELDVIHAYRMLRLLREFEDQLHVAIARGNVPGFTHLYAGEEASAVGVCLHLADRDVLCSTHRAHGHFLAKGGDVDALALEIFGKEGGACGGKGGSMHVADWSRGMWGANAIIGASVPHAIGAGFAFKYRGEDGVAVSFGGDGASNQGAGFESMNLAKILNLPVLFVLEDNGYAETTASGWAVAGRPVERAGGFGIPSVEVDGTDLLDVYTKIGVGVRRAREGGVRRSSMCACRCSTAITKVTRKPTARPARSSSCAPSRTASRVSACRCSPPDGRMPRRSTRSMRSARRARQRPSSARSTHRFQPCRP